MLLQEHIIVFRLSFEGSCFDALLQLWRSPMVHSFGIRQLGKVCRG